MPRRLVSLVVLVLLLTMAACTVTLGSFVVPTFAWSGSVFEIRISATISGNNGNANCAVQLPNGFAVVDYACTSNRVGPNPAFAASYAPEPGMHVEAFGGTGSEQNFGGTYNQVLQLFVRAAPGMSGSFPIKVALGGTDSVAPLAQDPPLNQFAQITDAAHTKTIVIVTAPVGEFAFDYDGLPFDYTARFRTWTGASCADLDGDGAAEILATHSSGLRVFHPQPHASAYNPGTLWAEQPTFPLLSTSRPRIADLDGDGQLDIVMGSGDHMFRHGSLWIGGLPLPLLQPGAESVAIGDVDNDGLPDLALGGHTSKTLQVLLNNGNRTFRDSSVGLPNFVGVPTTSDNVLFADFDGDGNLDLFWSTAVGSYAFRGDGHGAWTALTLPTFASSGDAVAIDIDGDGSPEIVNALAVVLRYAGNNTFALVTGTGLTGLVGQFVEALDQDRDGDMDLVFAGPLQVWTNDGLGHFTLHPATGLPPALVPTISDLQVGDIDGNTWPDLVVTVNGTGVFAFQNLRTGTAAFGEGCSGVGAQVPTLQAIGSPTRGNSSFALQLHCSTGPVVGGIWFDADRSHLGALTLPLDLASFGAPGCDLLVPPTFLTLGLSDPAGVFTAALPVPPVPALERMTVFAQGCACVPGANPAGKVFTAGLALRIN